MPIAKETLRIGFTIVATEGAYVSQAAVDEYGWADKVHKGKDVVAENFTDESAPASKSTKK